MQSQNQRGEGRVGFIITLVIALTGVFLAVKFVPVRVNAYEFRETLREEAMYVSVHRDNAQALKRILEKAESLKIPLSADDVKIQRTESEVIVKAHYQKPIDLKFTTYTYKFDAELRAPVF